MMMLHPAESASQHDISEVGWWLKLGDAYGKRLPDAEVASAPSYLLAQANETGCDPGDCAFPSASSRFGVQIDAAG